MSIYSLFCCSGNLLWDFGAADLCEEILLSIAGWGNSRSIPFLSLHIYSPDRILT